VRLTIEATLRRIGELLREDVAPDLATPFLGQSVRMAGSVLTICANWVDDAAAIRVEENAKLRAALGLPAASDPGLRISQLDAENHRLRLLLVAAHAAAEEAGDAVRVAAIWKLLEEIELARAQRE
jgi:hypothetical protein